MLCSTEHHVHVSSDSEDNNKQTTNIMGSSVSKLGKCWAWVEACALLSSFQPKGKHDAFFAWEIVSVIGYRKGKTRDIRFLSKTANIWDSTLRTGSEPIFHINTDQHFHCTWMILEPAAVCVCACVFVCVSVPKAIFCKAAVCCELVKVAGQISTSVSCS